jgi:predicted RNA polymerase sigma factor
VVRLNRAAVLAETDVLSEPLAQTERLAGSLEHYQPF